MTFDAPPPQHKPDAQIANPNGKVESNINGGELLAEGQGKGVFKTGDRKVAGNPNFEVGDGAVASTGKPPGVDAPQVRAEVASLVGTDLNNGSPQDVSNRLAQQRETQFNNHMSAIQGASSPDQLHSLLASLTDSTTAAAAASARITELQRLITA